MSGHADADQIAAFMHFGAATVHEAQGATGALDSALKPLSVSMRVAGPAFTVESRPGDNLAIQHAVTKAKPGDVLVVDAQGFVEAGPWGDLLTLYAQQVGVAGLVIDGSVRDSQAIVALGFPVFSRGVCIKGTGKHQPGRVNEPIVCAGVSIAPGDLIVGDADGVVSVPAADVGTVQRLCEERENKEAGLREAIRGGASLVELMGLQDRIADLGYH